MTKVPLVYPKIQGSKDHPSGKCILFEKIDGTNVHWVWSQTAGFNTFGLRRRQYSLNQEGKESFARNHAELSEATDLFEALSDPLIEIIEKLAASEVIVFTEFAGPNSFSGRHRREDEKRLVLIDVFVDGARMPPETFISLFKAFELPRVVYRGTLSGEVANDVRDGRFRVQEGVVAKSIKSQNGWMVKIKTSAYQERLKSHYGSKWKEYWE